MIRLAVAAFVAAGVLSATADDGLPTKPSAAWKAASQLLIDEAGKFFADGVKNEEQPIREMQLGEAVCLLNMQPKTESNIDLARSLLTTLASPDKGDDLSILASFYLARIDHIHAFQPNLVAAEKRYAALYAAHPAHPVAQLAAVRLVILRLYADIDDATFTATARDLLELGSKLDYPPARREFHRALADACLHRNLLKAEALDCLLETDRLGISRVNARLDTWVRIAEVARELGRKDIALAYYGKFLEAATRDDRVQLVRDRIRELQPGGE